MSIRTFNNIYGKQYQSLEQKSLFQGLRGRFCIESNEEDHISKNLNVILNIKRKN